MGRRSLFAHFAGVAAAGVLALGAPRAQAQAPTKPQCVDAATRGQVYRDDAKLRSASEAFALCASSSCPAVVAKSCDAWRIEVARRMPRVRVHVRPASDGLPTDLRVLIDEAPVGVDADVLLDPGSHKLRVEAPERAPYAEVFVVREGENRELAVPLAEKSASPPVDEPTRPLPLGVWILGGTAVLGVASFTYFGLQAKSETDELATRCAPVCTTEERDAAFRTALVADISLVVGVAAAAGAGALLYLWSKDGSTAAATVVPTRNGAVAGVAGAF